MKIIKSKCNLAFCHQQFTIYSISVICLILLNITKTFAQNTNSDDSTKSVESHSYTNRTLFGGTITNSGYGGIILKFTSFNNQPAFMTGGRGAFTINNRYTIGGGGYGIANSIDLPGSSKDSSRNFRMGYGGLELGYIFFKRNKVNIGGSTLIAVGAAFWQNDPKSDGEQLFDDDFNFLPVLEPSLYGEVALNRFIWLHAGISYRIVHQANLDYIKDKNIRGFSCYLGLLFGKPE